VKTPTITKPARIDRSETVPSRYATPPADARLSAGGWLANQLWNAACTAQEDAPRREPETVECDLYGFAQRHETGDLILVVTGKVTIPRVLAPTGFKGQQRVLSTPNRFDLVDAFLAGDRESEAWQLPDGVLRELVARLANNTPGMATRDLRRLAGAFSIAVAARHGCILDPHLVN
jgi:hypothetical protein